MVNNFDTNGMNNALNNISNGVEAADMKLRDLGWVKPQAYDYEAAIARGPSDSAGAGGVTWAHNFARYEWKEEFGEVGPAIPELEQELFGNEYNSRRGIKFEDLLTIPVTAEAQEQPRPIHDFTAASLHPIMVSNITMCGYDVPTPIQAYTIPAVIQGKDIIATAQTGSGKTAAYLIPTISKLMGKVKKIAAARPAVTADGIHSHVRAEPLILVVAPTRELCCQIFDEARRLCYRSMLRPCIAYGGAPTREQRVELHKGCDVLIATPGRLIDFMNDTDLLSLRRLRYTIIDEADEMLSDDWEEEMKKIMSGGDANESGDHQYLLFSATFNKSMRKLAKKFLAHDHVRIRIGRFGAVLNNVKQNIIYVDGNKKQAALFDLLCSLPPTRTMVFVKSKKTADFVDDFLFNCGMPSTSIHSDRTQREREDSIRAFRKGDAPILVTTGVAARGIDVRNVMHIINFDLPSVDHKGEDEYIHRIGRTARIGNEGLATSFYNDNDEPLAQFLVNTLVESNQEVPEFLSELKPADNGRVEWNDDSGDEKDEDNIGANDDAAPGWGAGGDVVDGGAPIADTAWGTSGAAATTVNDAWGTSNAADASGAW